MYIRTNHDLQLREGFKKKVGIFQRGGGGGGPEKNSNFSKNSAILLRMPWFMIAGAIGATISNIRQTYKCMRFLKEGRLRG